jgi:hypothetical protein
MNINRKYYNGEEVKTGDLFVGGWCGTCEIIRVSDNEVVAKNVMTKEVFELDGYMDSCDLLSRLKDEYGIS